MYQTRKLKKKDPLETDAARILSLKNTVTFKSTYFSGQLRKYLSNPSSPTSSDVRFKPFQKERDSLNRLLDSPLIQISAHKKYKSVSEVRESARKLQKKYQTPSISIPNTNSPGNRSLLGFYEVFTKQICSPRSKRGLPAIRICKQPAMSGFITPGAGDYEVDYEQKKSYAAFISPVKKSVNQTSFENTREFDVSASAANQYISLKSPPVGTLTFEKLTGRETHHHRSSSGFYGPTGSNKKAKNTLIGTIKKKISIMKGASQFMSDLKAEYKRAADLELGVSRSLDRVSIALHKKE